MPTADFAICSRNVPHPERDVYDLLPLAGLTVVRARQTVFFVNMIDLSRSGPTISMIQRGDTLRRNGRHRIAPLDARI